MTDKNSPVQPIMGSTFSDVADGYVIPLENRTKPLGLSTVKDGSETVSKNKGLGVHTALPDALDPNY